MKRKMNGFAKFVVTTLIVGTLFAAAMSIIFIGPKKVHAEAENISSEPTNLMFIGERSDYVIPDNVGKSDLIFSFPYFKIRNEYHDLRVSRRGGKEFVNPATQRFEEHINYSMSYFVFLIAAVIVFICSAWLVSFARKLMGTTRALNGFRLYP